MPSTPPPSPYAPPGIPAYDHPGTLELWVSRHLALYGTRAAVVDTTQTDGNDTVVRLTEGLDGEPAAGRYVYLRSFDSGAELRIDGLKIMALDHATDGRRAGETEEPEEPENPEAQRRLEDRAPDATLKKTHGQYRFSWTRVYLMRNLTNYTCGNATSPGLEPDSVARAKDARQRAAGLWAELSEPESAVGCIDCLTLQPMNCTNWFRHPYGYAGAHTAKHEQLRANVRRQIEEQGEERQRVLREAVGKSCCRVSRRTGKKECGEQFCQRAIREKASARIAHTLRRMHERDGPTELSVPQLVATDVLAPHLHGDERCRGADKRKKHGELECIALSLTEHLAKKHGFSVDALNQKMDKFGITIADMVTAHLKHTSTDGKKSKRKAYESDTAAAEEASALRRAEKARRKLGLEKTHVPERARPRASWIKRSTSRQAGARRLEDSEDTNEVVRIGVEPLGQSGAEVRFRKKQHAEYVRNQSMAAKSLVRTANLASATMGTKPATMTNLASAAWDASLATDGSLIGRARTMFGAFGTIGDKFAHMREVLHEAKRDHVRDQASKAAARKRRKLTDREEAYYKRIDDLAGGVGKGFRVPDHVNEQWGWIADGVDWRWWHDEAHRVGRVLYDRHDWVQAHAEEHGTLPVGELREEHKTGYAMLDVNAPPTIWGDWWRSKFTGGRRHAPHRNLAERRALHSLPRADSSDSRLLEEQPRSLIGAVLDASINGGDPMDAAWHALHHVQHRTRVRRLFETANYVTTETTNVVYDYGASLAPILFGEPTGMIPSEAPNPPAEAATEGLRQVGRYIVYDTLLCYLYPPPSMTGDSFGDGTNIELHYSNRACFPMIPFIPPDMVSFQEAYQLGPDFRFEDLEYENACDSPTVEALIGPMMMGLTSVGIIAAPYGSLLRFAEGIDSLRNLIGSGGSNTTAAERGAAVVCGIAQLGGLIWLAVVIIFLGVLCICAPCGSYFCLRCYRRCRGADRRDRARERAIDELLEATTEVGSAVVASKVKKRRMVGTMEEGTSLLS